MQGGPGNLFHAGCKIRQYTVILLSCLTVCKKRPTPFHNQASLFIPCIIPWIKKDNCTKEKFTKKNQHKNIFMYKNWLVYLKAGRTIWSINPICRLGIDARSLSIISMGLRPKAFSKSPWEKNSLYNIFYKDRRVNSRIKGFDALWWHGSQEQGFTATRLWDEPQFPHWR